MDQPRSPWTNLLDAGTSVALLIARYRPLRNACLLLLAAFVLVVYYWPWAGNYVLLWTEILTNSHDAVRTFSAMVIMVAYIGSCFGLLVLTVVAAYKFLNATRHLLIRLDHGESPANIIASQEPK